MFCSLAGISPCDIILQGIDSRTVRLLLQLVNNRFDVGRIRAFKSEIDYVLKVLDGLVFDYENREDRILSKKLNIPSMTAFGGVSRDDVEMRLASARKEFTGNINVDGQVIAVGSDKVKDILNTLWQGRGQLVSLRNSIEYGSFSDEAVFGKPLTWWSTSRGNAWLSVYAAECLERSDNLQGMRKDAEKLLSYVGALDAQQEECGTATDANSIRERSAFLEFLKNRYTQLSGREVDAGELVLAEQLWTCLGSHGMNSLGTPMTPEIITLFVNCLLLSRQYDPEVAERLEQCGLFFMNPYRAEFMLESFADLTLIPERRIVLQNPEYGDSYETILGAIIAACDDALTPIGADLTGGVS